MARNVAGAVTFPAGVAVGVGVGGAVGGALAPRLQELENLSWAHFQSLPLMAEIAALLAAEGYPGDHADEDEAALTGVKDTRFAALVEAERIAPDVSMLLGLWRRGFIGEGQVDDGLAKLKIKSEYRNAIKDMREVLLSPSELANARQQGFVDDAEQIAQAGRQGVSPDRAEIQFQLAGLPPGPETMQRAATRGLADRGTFDQAIREGHTKTKYTELLWSLREQVLTASQWATAWLKGHATEAQAKAGGAAVGYDADAMELLYLNQGRPATTRQIHIGYARGAQVPGVASEEAAIRAAVKQSNVRTEYADLLYAQRYTYPSAFVLRALATDGTFSEAETRQILVESGWKPEWAEAAAAKWSGAGTAGPGTKWADRARSRLFTAAHDDYLDGNADESDARAMLAAVGASDAERDTIITLWNLERNRTRRDLTQAQILKLYRKVIWTREQAQAALEDQGMAPGDAADLLDSVG